MSNYRGHLGRWLIEPFGPPVTLEDGVVIGVWWATVALALWFLCSIAIWAVALRSGRPLLVTVARRCTIWGSRKFVENSLAMGLALLGPACSMGTIEPAPTLTFIASVSTTTTQGPIQTSARDSTTTLQNTTETDVPPAEAQVETPTNLNHEVQRGDNMWKIATEVLTREFEREPSNAEVVAYWRQLIDLNRANLISRNPDLIYPGETLSLPATGFDEAS